MVVHNHLASIKLEEDGSCNIPEEVVNFFDY
jgi:hypothetical protein